MRVRPGGGVLPQHRVVNGGAARKGQHHGNGGVGNLGSAVVRYIAHGDARLACEFQIDVVVAHAVAHDDAAFFQMRDHAAVHRDARHHDAVAVLPRLEVDGVETGFARVQQLGIVSKNFFLEVEYVRAAVGEKHGLRHGGIPDELQSAADQQHRGTHCNGRVASQRRLLSLAISIER